jgi:hypothetical protein
VVEDARLSDLDALSFWRAVATIPVDRRSALLEVEEAFASGALPEGLDGFHRGRLVATTVGYGLDLLWETVARLWMPWKGKVFRPGEGRNVFDASARPLTRLMAPGYRGVEEGGAGRFTAFRFRTSAGPSGLIPGVQVLRIDYDLEENPGAVRRVLDELVRISEGLYLGQALLRLRGRERRVAWFALES